MPVSLAAAVAASELLTPGSNTRYKGPVLGVTELLPRSICCHTRVLRPPSVEENCDPAAGLQATYLPRNGEVARSKATGSATASARARDIERRLPEARVSILIVEGKEQVMLPVTK